jgi:hypothetical protein
MFVRQASVCLVLLALVFVGMNIAPSPATLPPAHGQSIGVVGTILGLATIAGIVYLISRDRYGVYHRYPYGHYNGGRYVYDGAYYQQYPQYHAYRGRWYRGDMPRNWRADHGCVNGYSQNPHCR